MPSVPPARSTSVPERLPAINFSIMKETVLRKKLRDLGVPDSGTKHLLQRRYTEWMNIWNANCDGKTPKTKAELLRELDIWERTQGSQAPFNRASNPVLEKNFNTSAWSVTHNDDYKSLIASARAKKKQKSTVTDENEAPEPTKTAGGNNNAGHEPLDTDRQPTASQEPTKIEGSGSTKEKDQDFKDNYTDLNRKIQTDDRNISADDAVS